MKAGSPRPTSVTTLVVLTIILAVLSILTGLAGVVIGALAVDYISTLADSILLDLGAVIVGFGILEIVYAVGFIDGKGWSWTLGMIIAIVSLVSSLGLIGLSAIAGPFDSIALFEVILIDFIAIIPIVTSAVTVGILTRPRVKAFFGKGPAAMGSFAKPMEVN
jgi:hypothetical protein